MLEPPPVAPPRAGQVGDGNAEFLPSRRRRPAARRLALELGAVAAVLLATLVALAHLVLSARSEVFFSNGDSVLLPLIARSLAAGGHPTWVMSSVLFVFPEAPAYLAISSLVPGVHGALLVSAVVNVLALYFVLRGLAAAAAPRLSARTRVIAAGAPVVALMALTLLEHTADRSTFELVSLYLTTTYYYGTTLALIASLSLVLLAVRCAGAVRRDGVRQAVDRGPLAGLAAVTAVATLSNPLFLIWATGPLLVGLVMAVRLRTLPRSPAVRIGAVAAAAGVAGWIARLPLRRYIAADLTTYLRPDKTLHSAGYYIGDYFRTAFTVQGAVEMTLLASAICATLSLTIVAARRNWPTITRLGLLLASSTMIVSTLAAVILGTTATRYLMPLYVAPTTAAVLVLLHLAYRRGDDLAEAGAAILRSRPSRLRRRRVVAGALVAALVVGGTAFVLVRTAPSTRPSSSIACVSSWIDGRDITGAGRFWTIRSLQTYGDSSIRLLQITPTYGAALWLNDVSEYRGQTISYLVVSSSDDYETPPGRALGTPAATVACGEFTILDYTGTPGQELLTQQVTASAKSALDAQGLKP